jgi:hypothetical protein
MLWQHLSSLFSRFGFIGILCVVLYYRTLSQPAARRFVTVCTKLAGLWAFLVGLAVIVSAVMTINQDHLLTASRWGHHGLRELMLAIGCSVLGMLAIGLGLALFRHRRPNPAILSI